MQQNHSWEAAREICRVKAKTATKQTGMTRRDPNDLNERNRLRWGGSEFRHSVWILCVGIGVHSTVRDGADLAFRGTTEHPLQ